MIQCNHMSCAFGKTHTALANIDLEIKRGEFVFLVGHSGAGKTTLLRTIMGSHKPIAGEILVGNPPVNIYRVSENKMASIRQSIGYIFQDFRLISTKNIAENIAVALEIAHYPRRLMLSEITRVLHLVGLVDKAHTFPLELSVGEQQRAAIARAIAGGRTLLLADEPTGNLDPESSWGIMSIFTQLPPDYTIVFSTHNMDLVNSLQKRVVKLQQGMLV